MLPTVLLYALCSVLEAFCQLPSPVFFLMLFCLFMLCCPFHVRCCQPVGGRGLLLWHAAALHFICLKCFPWFVELEAMIRLFVGRHVPVSVDFVEALFEILSDGFVFFMCGDRYLSYCSAQCWVFWRSCSALDTQSNCLSYCSWVLRLDVRLW